MPNVCPVCEKQFYSDSEFGEHIFLHKLEKAFESQQSGLRSIVSLLMLANMLKIAELENLPIPQTYERYCVISKEFAEHFNKEHGT